ncbi:MAG: hypothetical protein ONB44_18530 [candidate division KSB1 bacterium]|nr:hypothetical protein [candidate division KSB1 bacterium]MDZ7304127.1 hypothetical protein [candidate division KSB1 bacterium]MDZ7314082.1 hypothetical protein [candidate division KSB1 bacterium]
MTDNLYIPQRLDGEHAPNANPLQADTSLRSNVITTTKNMIHTIDQVSVEAVINVLLKRGICTEAELLAEENRLYSVREAMTNFNFTPVQINRPDHAHRHRRDPNPIRRWAAKHHWSRRLGTLIFGWKWHRKKKEL